VRLQKTKLEKDMSNKAIFLDRDDTLIEDPGYINSPDQVKLIDGVAEALIELKAMGYKLVVVSNQSGIARGIVTEKAIGEIHDRLKQLLALKGAFLDAIYYCPYHPDGAIEKYRKESDCRKPNPGMFLAAANEMNIDLGQSWSVGNSGRDTEAGRRAGCKTILIDTPLHKQQFKPGEPKADYKAVNMKEAVNIIKKYIRSSNASVPLPPPTITTQPTIVTPPTVTNAEESHNSETTEPTEPTASQIKPMEENAASQTVEHLLGSILEQLKRTHRENMFGEFYIMRLLAGIVQVIVLFCLLISIWYLMSPVKQYNPIFITLGFAIVLQLIALTFYMIQGRK
jgi:D-glycero-D-manno-heptose 1,7-bisphosphate phosphatase